MTTEPIMHQVDGEAVDYSACPLHGESMRLYFEHRCHPGSGIQAILENDLRAVVICDDETVRQLPAIWRWLHNHAPAEAFGTPEKVAAWLRGPRNQHVHPHFRPLVNSISGGDRA